MKNDNKDFPGISFRGVYSLIDKRVQLIFTGSGKKKNNNNLLICY